jgi:hypothetical protein
MLWRTATIGLAGFAAVAMTPAPQVADLEWLKGSWVAEYADGWTEEQWTDARGGVMLGTNRSGKGAKATGFEYMRIAADDKGGVSFWGSPLGAPPVAFRLISLNAQKAVFENPAHDYPTRIVYRLEDGVLTGTVSGPEGKNPLSWTFRRPAGR